MGCKLKPYESRLDAGSEAVRLTRRNKFEQRKTGVMIRVVSYHCTVCGKWHLKEESTKLKQDEESQ